MLSFIERFQEYRDGKKGFPRKIEQINEMLTSVRHGRPYWIMAGDKKGRYEVVNTLRKDEFGCSEMYGAYGLDSACSTIHRLICKNPEFKPLTKIDFQARKEIVNKFPKKYHKLLNSLLNEILTFDLYFIENESSNLLTPDEGIKQWNSFQKEDEAFAYLTHSFSFTDGVDPNDDSLLMDFIESLFEVDINNIWALTLRLKKPIVSPQQKWNQKNPETIKESDRAYKERNPNYQFYPSPKLIEKIEAERKTGESTSILINRLLDKSLPTIKKTAKTKTKYKLPGELKQFEAIAQPVLELFESFFKVKQLDGCRDIAKWKLFDTESKKSCHLFLVQGFQWSLEPLKINDELPECFDFDIYEFCDCNEVYIEEMYENLEV